MAAFLDIEGAFNNVEANSILESLNDLEVEGYISIWIAIMLKSRKITANLGGYNLTRFVSRGTPQGGVLSPLLGLANMNSILLSLNQGGVQAVAYADNVVLLVSGPFLDTISNLMEGALRKLSCWAKS